jgi:hypothetical protein
MTSDGASIVEHLAGAEDFQLALATYRAAVERASFIQARLRRGEANSGPRWQAPKPGLNKREKIVAKATRASGATTGINAQIAALGGSRKRPDPP